MTDPAQEPEKTTAGHNVRTRRNRRPLQQPQCVGNSHKEQRAMTGIRGISHGAAAPVLETWGGGASPAPEKRRKNDG